MREPLAALVIGGGPAGLMAAEVLAKRGHAVVIADAAPSPARKFLLAGRGGLNLTHSEPADVFLGRYGAASEALAPALAAFGPERLRAWSEALGEPTFVGTSGRVFPKSFKATALLRAWLRDLEILGVTLRTRHKFIGWSEAGAARFVTPSGESEIPARVTVLALGGASWPRLGGDGSWVEVLRGDGVKVAPLTPSNAGVLVDWSAHMQERFAGEPLKAARWSIGGHQTRAEAVVAVAGLEGGAIYALSSPIREALEAEGAALVSLDLKPDMKVDGLAARLTRPKGASMSTFLRKAAGLSPLAIALLREAGPIPVEGADLAARIKACVLRISGMATIARAISSAGGVAWSDIDETYQLRARPGVFVAGEMIDWEAPTGGYLLQAVFATGAAAGRAASEALERD